MNTLKFIVGQQYRTLLEQGLWETASSVLWLPDNPDVAPALCGHADLSVALLRAGAESHLFLAPYLNRTEFARSLYQSYGIYHDSSMISFIREKQSAGYPEDVPLNIRQIGNAVFLNPKTASSDVLCFLDRHPELRQIHINQGYTACSILPCGEHALITADEGIAYAAARADFEVLKISPGHIDLPGYAYGFVGGSAFPLRKDHIAFTGTLTLHPDQKRILDFLREQSITPVYLTDRPLFDIGAAIPFGFPEKGVIPSV